MMIMMVVRVIMMRGKEGVVRTWVGCYACTVKEK